MSGTRVNIGSGFNGLEGWINLDNSVVARLSKIGVVIKCLVRIGLLPMRYRARKWPPIKTHDCRKGLPFENGTVDVIYSSHFFEHVYRSEALFILRECERSLKKGGIMRVVLPDVKKITRAYLNKGLDILNRTEQVDKVVPFGLCDYFVMQFYPAELNGAETPSVVTKIQERALARHKWMYDSHTFAQLMAHAGFDQVVEMECGQSKIEEAGILDQKAETSFFLETEKS